MRVMIVEDDGVLADGLAASMKRLSLAVDCVGDAEKAETLLAADEHDLLILDIGLPGMSGFDLLSRVRGRGARVPVLILTARDEVNDRVRGLDLGADDYLVKPFALPEFEARVRALIRRGRTGSGPVISYGPLSLDTVAHRAWLRGEPLDLTGREWAILQFMMAHAGHVLSKERIVQSLCSWDQELSLNAIEVYISRLRAKLEPGGVKVRTVRGFGYLLEEPRGEH